VYLNHLDYLPSIDRPTLRWPNGARLAFWISPNVEHYEYRPSFDGQRNPYPRSPYPDVQQYSNYDYGNRVGFWRMLEVLDRHEVPCTVSLNLSVLSLYPEIRTEILARKWEVMTHGFYNTQYVTTFSEDQERAFIHQNIDVVARLAGQRLKGMLGPAVTDTDRTSNLLAEAGLTYHCDWVHDDQPSPINVGRGRLVSVPYSMDTNDGMVYRYPCPPEYFADICKAQFDRLYLEGAASGQVMCVALHPFLIGRPQRIRVLDDILGYVRSHDDVWFTTAGEIAEYFIANYYDEWVAHAAGLARRYPVGPTIKAGA
jgi:peptidoglycan/xylan/chitin deacetylase (PgdA/CDA1 family)